MPTRPLSLLKCRRYFPSFLDSIFHHFSTAFPSFINSIFHNFSTAFPSFIDSIFHNFSTAWSIISRQHFPSFLDNIFHNFSTAWSIISRQHFPSFLDTEMARVNEIPVTHRQKYPHCTQSITLLLLTCDWKSRGISSHGFNSAFPEYSGFCSTWWRHQMEAFSSLQAFCAGNSLVTTQRPVMRSFDVFFDLRLNKRLSKQAWGWWSGPVFCLFLGVSSDYAQPITGQVTEVTCPVIGRAQPELTPSKRQKMGPEAPSRSLLRHCNEKG